MNYFVRNMISSLRTISICGTLIVIGAIGNMLLIEWLLNDYSLWQALAIAMCATSFCGWVVYLFVVTAIDIKYEKLIKEIL